MHPPFLQSERRNHGFQGIGIPQKSCAREGKGWSSGARQTETGVPGRDFTSYDNLLAHPEGKLKPKQGWIRGRWFCSLIKSKTHDRTLRVDLALGSLDHHLIYFSSERGPYWTNVSSWLLTISYLNGLLSTSGWGQPVRDPRTRLGP